MFQHSSAIPNSSMFLQHVEFRWNDIHMTFCFLQLVLYLHYKFLHRNFNIDHSFHLSKDNTKVTGNDSTVKVASSQTTDGTL